MNSRVTGGSGVVCALLIAKLFVEGPLWNFKDNKQTCTRQSCIPLHFRCER